MKIVINRKKRVRALIILMLLLEVNFWGVLPFAKGWDALNSSVHKTLIILIALYSLFKYRGIFSNNSYKWLRKYLIFILACFGLFFFNTFLRYPLQGAYYDYRMVEHLLVIFVAPTIVLYCQEEGDIVKLMRTIMIVCLIYGVIQFINEIYYLNNGSLLFTGNYSTSGALARIRFNRIRMGLGSLVNIMIPISFDKVLSKVDRRYRFLYLLNTILGTVDAIFVQMSRSYLVIIAICSTFVLLHYLKRKRRFMIAIIILIVATLVIAKNGVIDFLVHTFLDTTNQYYVSTSARLVAIPYYLYMFIKNPILGFGFLRSDTPYYYTIMHGSTGQYFVDDVGIIGFMAQGGILALIIYGAFLYRIISDYRTIKNKSDRHFFGILLAFILLTTPSLICTDQVRIFTLPLVLGIAEYFRCQYTINTANTQESEGIPNEFRGSDV